MEMNESQRAWLKVSARLSALSMLVNVLLCERFANDPDRFSAGMEELKATAARDRVRPQVPAGGEDAYVEQVIADLEEFQMKGLLALRSRKA